MTLGRYICLRFLRMMFLTALVIAGLVGLLASVENFRLAASQDASVGIALVLTLHQLPQILGQTFPLVMMLASLATFLSLSRSSEMVIVRASGVSGLRVLIWPLAAAALIGVLATAAFNPIIAASSVRAGEIRDEITGNPRSILSVDKRNVWLRQGLETGQTVIQAQRVSERGAVLYGVLLHEFDTDNELVARVQADSAILSRDAWLLRGVLRWSLKGPMGTPIGRPEALPQLNVPTNLTREQILDSFAQPQAISIWALPAFISQLEQAGFAATRHRIFFQAELARPLLFVAMTMIGAAFSLRHVRFGNVGVMILFAVLAGFSLFFFKDIAETLGGNGDVPILLAAWSPPVAAILLITGLLLHLEDG
ncbi:MAG: LPS export ABC transporter permease LptG [Pseudomonadota bacterium]